jgi:NitT/TauT family transport system ATP-binding protein
VDPARRRQARAVREGGRHVVRPKGAGQVQVLSAGRTRIVIRDLAKTFREDGREVTAVQDVSFDVRDHEFVAIVGPSGCGKSTILNMIGGLVRPTGGTIAIDGTPVAGTVPPHVGYVFQKDTVFPWRTVARNIALGLEYRGVHGAERDRRVRDAVRLAGLEGFEEAFPATLSGGMRQRVALMRTLIVEPEILLMDEPFGALDTHTKINLHAELLSLWEARHQTVVFVTHDLSEAITLADRIVVMTRRPGRVKMVHAVRLSRPRDVIKLRETEEYAHEYGRIWHVLGEEFAGAAP